MRTIKLLFLLAVALIRTRWTFRGEHGVEADDPDKEHDV